MLCAIKLQKNVSSYTDRISTQAQLPFTIKVSLFNKSDTIMKKLLANSVTVITQVIGLGTPVSTGRRQ